MIKAIASAVVLAVFVFAPVHTASAGALRDLNCSAAVWTIQGNSKASDVSITIQNECTDPITVVLIKRGTPTVIGIVLPGNIETVVTRIGKNQSVAINPNFEGGAGDAPITVETLK